jgi:hypothetical protein
LKFFEEVDEALFKLDEFDALFFEGGLAEFEVREIVETVLDFVMGVGR